MKICVNRCYGGFGLSNQALEAIATRKHLTLQWYTWKDEEVDWESEDAQYCRIVGNRNEFSFRDYEFRTDPELIAVVEELGSDANGWCSKLEIINIPANISYEIHDYDGQETVREQHRSW